MSSYPRLQSVSRGIFEQAQKTLFQQILADIVPKYLSRNPGDMVDSSRAAQEREEKESKVENCTLVSGLPGCVSSLPHFRLLIRADSC